MITSVMRVVVPANDDNNIIFHLLSCHLVRVFSCYPILMMLSPREVKICLVLALRELVGSKLTFVGSASQPKTGPSIIIYTAN